MDNNPDNGVRINLISSRKLDTMTSEDKLRFILDEVKRGTVLVLERGLTAVEEIDLIKATMSEIDHQTFVGIEMQSYSSTDLATGSWLDKLLGRTKVPRMSVIGPANLLKTIYKDGSMIQAMILTGETIVSGTPSEAGDVQLPAGEMPGMPGQPLQGMGMVPEEAAETSEGAVEPEHVPMPGQGAAIEDGQEPPVQQAQMQPVPEQEAPQPPPGMPPEPETATTPEQPPMQPPVQPVAELPGQPAAQPQPPTQPEAAPPVQADAQLQEQVQEQGQENEPPGFLFRRLKTEEE